MNNYKNTLQIQPPSFTISTNTLKRNHQYEDVFSQRICHNASNYIQNCFIFEIYIYICPIYNIYMLYKLYILHWNQDLA